MTLTRRVAVPRLAVMITDQNLNPSVLCGCRQNRRHNREIESWLTVIPLLRRSQSASLRDDQCVRPSARRAQPPETPCARVLYLLMVRVLAGRLMTGK